MLRPLSDLNVQVYRYDYDTVSGVWNNCVTGTWVTLDSNGLLALAWEDAITGAGAPYCDGHGVWQVWNENQTNVAGAFSPDVAQTGKLTTLKGSYRALTDRFVTGEAVAVGRQLYVDNTVANAGLLTIHSPEIANPIAAFAGNVFRFPVAVILGVQTNVTYRGVTYPTLIEIMTHGV